MGPRARTSPFGAVAAQDYLVEDTAVLHEPDEDHPVQGFVEWLRPTPTGRDPRCGGAGPSPVDPPLIEFVGGTTGQLARRRAPDWRQRSVPCSRPPRGPSKVGPKWRPRRRVILAGEIHAPDEISVRSLVVGPKSGHQRHEGARSWSAQPRGMLRARHSSWPGKRATCS